MTDTGTPVPRLRSKSALSRCGAARQGAGSAVNGRHICSLRPAACSPCRLWLCPTPSSTHHLPLCQASARHPPPRPHLYDRHVGGRLRVHSLAHQGALARQDVSGHLPAPVWGAEGKEGPIICQQPGRERPASPSTMLACLVRCGPPTHPPDAPQRRPLALRPPRGGAVQGRRVAPQRERRLRWVPAAQAAVIKESQVLGRRGGRGRPGRTGRVGHSLR